MNEAEWKDYVKGVLKAEIARRNLYYPEISEHLAKIGLHEAPQNISNKIGRGTLA